MYIYSMPSVGREGGRGGGESIAFVAAGAGSWTRATRVQIGNEYTCGLHNSLPHHSDIQHIINLGPHVGKGNPRTPCPKWPPAHHRLLS